MNNLQQPYLLGEVGSYQDDNHQGQVMIVGSFSIGTVIEAHLLSKNDLY